MEKFQTIKYIKEKCTLRLLDQTRLPLTETYLNYKTVEEVWGAIKCLEVRGAPAIGVAAAYGVVLAAKKKNDVKHILDSIYFLSTSRPTAVNLFWALSRMKSLVIENKNLPEMLEEEADKIYKEEEEACWRIGDYGKSLIKDGMNILTHCNAGALATVNWGTALAPIYMAHQSGLKVHVYCDETRPLLQGSRLTAWELMQEKVPCTLICDSMAAYVMSLGKIDLVIVGADRIAANGDTANKIGTYGVAIAARAHGIPFYIAAPMSTFDFSKVSGQGIVIEERHLDEVRKFSTKPTAPAEVLVFNPAFDVTPVEFISGFITDKGIFKVPRDIPA